MAPVFHNLARHDILGLDIPDTFFVVPCSTLELMLQLDIAVKVVLFRDSFEIGKDLIPGGVAKILLEMGFCILRAPRRTSGTSPGWVPR